MTERYLIAKVEMTKTKSGKQVAALYSQNQRLSYPVLYLFDLSMLQSVGIDPNTMPKIVYQRFWAYYEESSKRNSEGNPYKDVLYLEQIDQPATSTSTDTSAILQELRTIRRLLERIAGQPAQVPVTMPQETGSPEEETIDADLADLSTSELRVLYYQIAGPAIATGTITPARVNQITQLANGSGWAAAVSQLRKEIQE